MLKESLPYGIFLYFMFLSAYLMKRCRIPAGLMFFFVAPLGLLLQGQALMFILPEMLGMTVFLQCLAALVAGNKRVSMVLLAIALSLDSRLVLPLLPVILLGLMRTMGCRRALLWMLVSLSGFLLISSRFLSPAYLIRLTGMTPSIQSQWNPIVWCAHWIEEEFKLNLLTRNKLEWVMGSVIPGLCLQILSTTLLINFRWLQSDGGIIGLISKFMKSHRGHGIRPNPWTPRQTLTIIFESILISSLLRFPSLLHAEEFELLTVMVSGFFCVALADQVPIPALVGIFTGLSFPLSFLYREFESELGADATFHPKLMNTLHFLPMFVLPIVQVAILILFTRRDINSSSLGVAQKLSPTQSVQNVLVGHRRSSSLSRRR